MFVLDTNVVSELRMAKAGKADPNVIAWAASTRGFSGEMIRDMLLIAIESASLVTERRIEPNASASTAVATLLRKRSISLLALA